MEYESKLHCVVIKGKNHERLSVDRTRVVSGDEIWFVKITKSGLTNYTSTYMDLVSQPGVKTAI